MGPIDKASAFVWVMTWWHSLLTLRSITHNVHLLLRVFTIITQIAKAPDWCRLDIDPTRKCQIDILSTSIQQSMISGQLIISYFVSHDGVSNHQRLDCLLSRLFGHRSKKASKLRVNGFCEGNSLVTGEFRAQRASNAENISIWWRHHVTSFPKRV